MSPTVKYILKNTLALSTVAAFLSSCAIGPNFKRPAPPPVSSYTPDPLTNTVMTTNVIGGQAQHFVEDCDISGEWWNLFHSKPLNDLIERALTNSPSIKAAQAALLVAREGRKAQQGSFWPSLAGSFSASRQKQSDLLAPVPNANVFTYNLFTPQITVSYEPDVFGLNRRTVESLKAQEDQQKFALIATHITLSANIVSAAIQEAALRAQIASTRRLVEFNRKALDVLHAQFNRGYAARPDVAAQEAQLAQIQATLPPLLKQLAQQRDLIAVLAGVFPSQQPAEEFELANLQLPVELPVSLPSRLVAQRPDVRQAEETMHAASAEIGIAEANRLPNITISANAGNTALAIDQLFTSGTGFWSVGAAATQPIFEGGALLHKQRAAKAAYVQAAEQYRGTVLTAFQNVADTLVALEQDADALKTAAAAEGAAKITLDISQKQFQTGYANYLSLLSAEQVYQQAEITLVQAQANRYADTAALFLALGGGWWHRADLTKS